MSERLSHSPERHESKPSPEHHKRQRELQEQIIERGESARHEYAEKLGEIRKETEELAKSSHEAVRHTPEAPADNPEIPEFINKDLKNQAYARTLKRAQRQLPAPARAFSKVIHQPVVETISDLSASTIARPSGILAGGITAFLGSTLFLWLARHYGYEYNFLLFALLFAGGFFIGLLVELGLYFAARRQR